MTTIWIHSDLQFHLPHLAEPVLKRAIDDLEEVGVRPDEVWCLGDALCGEVQSELEEVARGVLRQLLRLRVPISYIMGNHELDLKRLFNLNSYPLHELARQHALWHVPDLETPYLIRTIGCVMVVLLGDHAAHDGSWWTTHGKVRGDTARYPAYPTAYQTLRERMERHPGPVILGSHYAFPGGPRPSPLLANLLPLPENVRFHLHGHAHFGDTVQPVSPARCSPIDGEEVIRQFNISALENIRSPGIHSAVLTFDDSPFTSQLSIRCHDTRRWLNHFTLCTPTGRTISSAITLQEI